MNKRLADELKPILQKNKAPAIRHELRLAQIRQLTHDAGKMDILSRRSLLEHIFLQASYLSRWIWLVQASLPALLFYYGIQGNHMLVFTCMMMLAPCLTLALLYELSKSFRSGMWEMEAPCRYNLQQLLAMRICFLSGTDTAVLLAALLCFRMVGGSLWQFALYVLIPFFLASALCLGILRRYAHRVSQYLLAAVSLSFLSVFVPLLQGCNTYMLAHHAEMYEKIITLSTVGALLLFICCSVRLCRRQKQENTAQSWEYM